MFQVRTVRFNRWCGFAVYTVAWFSLCADGHAQFHQTQPGTNGPLAPTVPNPFQPTPFASGNSNLGSAGLLVGNQDGSRSDSTIAGVRPLINLPTNSGLNAQNPNNYPTSVPTSGTTETQQGLGLPALPGRSGAPQEPWQSNWQSSLTPQGNQNSGSPTIGNSPLSGQSGLIPMGPGNGATSNGFIGSNWSGQNSSNPQTSIPLIQQPGGEVTAPGSRFLTADQPNPQRSSQSVAQRQAEIANNWDPYINLPTTTTPAMRRGRSTVTGQDGLDDFMFPSQGNSTLTEDPLIPKARQVTNTESDPRRETVQNESQSTPQKASMDALSWWLMMCSVMANLILFYFLYDSRAKYLNLADELQSRFFREG